MPSELMVAVPQDLAWDLLDEGFRQVEQLRGMDWLAQEATIAVNVIGASANLATLLLARDSALQFIRHIAAWATKRAVESAENQITVHFEVTHAGYSKAHQTIDARFTSTDSISGAEMSALLSFMAVAFSDHESSATTGQPNSNS